MSTSRGPAGARRLAIKIGRYLFSMSWQSAKPQHPRVRSHEEHANQQAVRLWRLIAPAVTRCQSPGGLTVRRTSEPSGGKRIRDA
jgi:hypothetical protein